jgi:hypothetical protein
VTVPRAALFVLALGATVIAQPRQADIAHMRYMRPVAVDAPRQQTYVVIDEETWRRSRRDLGDLRMVRSDGHVVPYARRTVGAIRNVQEVPARVLQPGRVGDDTRVWIQVPEHVAEYNRVRLDVSARNFVASARVEGANAEPAPEWVDLGTHSLFDFSREGLGSSTVLQLPPTRFRYLRVTVPGDIEPRQVSGASVASSVRQDAQWMPLAAVPERHEEASRTIFRWSAAEHVPLEGVRIDVAPEQQNFIRRVEVLAARRVVASGTIRRVHRVHDGTTIDTEELTIPVPAAHHEAFEAVIHNGDDPPLEIARVTPLVLERRLYLDPGADRTVKLYFGDDEARAPEYEFAELFVEEPEARPASLGPIAVNPAYLPRPDLRPWSERHPAVIWAALALAVLAIGALAVRALRS